MVLTCCFDWLGDGKFVDHIIYLTSSLAKHSTRIKYKLPEICFLISGGLLILENDAEHDSAIVDAICSDNREDNFFFKKWTKLSR